MLLKLNNTAKFYGSRLIFKEVSLELERGSIILLAGANGAGKSTLLKIMAGLLRPSAGTVEYGLEKGEQIGYLGHQTFIYPALSALENLNFWNKLHALKKSQAELGRLLERVELERFAQERAGAFSRGMAQRLNLARILLIAPALLLLDEPATGLDIRSSAILDNEIQAAARHGSGVVWISHSLEEDLPKADSLAILDGAGLAFFGGAEAYRNYQATVQRGLEQSDCPAAGAFKEPQADAYASKARKSGDAETNKPQAENAAVNAATGRTAGEDAKKHQTGAQ